MIVNKQKTNTMTSAQEHLPFPHEQDIAPPLHDWNMQARRGGGMETRDDVRMGIEQRLEVHGSDDPTTPADAMQFAYGPHDFHTTIEYWDDEMGRTVREELPLEEYLQDSYDAD